MTEEMRVLVREGLERHKLVDQCRCESCKEHYGPDGSPGRCGRCYDAQQGEVCVERSAYLALKALLDKGDQVTPQHMDLEDCPLCAKQFCPDCDKVVRYGVNPNNPPDHCPKCGTTGRLTLRGVRHINLDKAADHRMTHRLEQDVLRDTTAVFRRLPNGVWGVRGRGLQEGSEVTVVRRDGEETTVLVGRILDVDEFGMSVAEVARDA